MKITTKTTREELKKFLGANSGKVKKVNEELYTRLAYASSMLKKDEKKVTRSDLVDLAKEVIKALGDKVVEPVLAEEKPVEEKVEIPKQQELKVVQQELKVVAENSVKKQGKGLAKKQEPAEKPVEVKEEKPAENTAKKPLGAKSKKGDDTDSKGTVQNKLFPNSLKFDDTNYELARDITSMEDLYEALESNEEIVFAFYYNKKMLRQAPYFYDMFGRPKGFENDLDLATTIYVSDERRIAYHISLYTEACYNTLPEDFEEVEGIRYAGTMMFQIYRAVKA